MGRWWVRAGWLGAAPDCADLGAAQMVVVLGTRVIAYAVTWAGGTARVQEAPSKCSRWEVSNGEDSQMPPRPSEAIEPRKPTTDVGRMSPAASEARGMGCTVNCEPFQWCSVGGGNSGCCSRA